MRPLLGVDSIADGCHPLQYIISGDKRSRFHKDDDAFSPLYVGLTPTEMHFSGGFLSTNSIIGPIFF